jgi:mannose-6-phosphate isomerase-like protein (cupin superfamily)
MMSNKTTYNIKTDIKFSPMEKFDIQDVVDANTDTWFNQTLVRINDSVLRLGVLEGEFHFHKHDDGDEFFYVVEGNLLLDVEDLTHELGPGQGFVVPKGVVHRTRAPSRVVVLVTASADVVPVGD